MLTLRKIEQAAAILEKDSRWPKTDDKNAGREIDAHSHSVMTPDMAAALAALMRGFAARNEGRTSNYLHGAIAEYFYAGAIDDLCTLILESRERKS